LRLVFGGGAWANNVADIAVESRAQKSLFIWAEISILSG
jgi:hypothetical protein